MLRSKTFLFLALCSSIVCVPLPAIAGEKVLVTADCEIRTGKFGVPVAEVDVGSFLPGTVIAASLVVRNRSNRELTFGQLEKSCGCLSVSPEHGKISVDGELAFEIGVKASTSPSRVNNTVRVTGLDTNGQVFNVDVRYSHKGVVLFRDNFMQIDVPKGIENFNVEIPFSCDEHSSESLVTLSTSEAIRDYGFELKFRDRKVLLSIPATKIPIREITGEIVLANIESGFSSRMPVCISTVESLKVYPSRLRFREECDIEGKCQLKTNLMIVDTARLDDEALKGSTFAEFFWGDKKLTSTIIDVRRHVTRMALTLPGLSIQEIQDSPKHIRCELTGVAGKVSVDMAITIDLDYSTAPLSEGPGK